MRTVVLASLIFCCATAAEAQELPRYDVESHCKDVAAFGGAPSETIRQGCFQMEQQAYNRLKEQWAELPRNVRQHCDEVASFGGSSSYSILKGCIDMEMQAAQDNRSSTFQY